MTNTTNAAAKIETQPCSRCGGSGQYSYCTMHGTTCFKCGGAKNVMTKRGKAANDYLVSLRSRRAAELKVGDLVKIDVGFVARQMAWAKVEAVGPDQHNPGLYTITTNKIVIGTKPDTMIRVKQTDEQIKSTYEQAMAYQATLKVDGTPRKR